MLPGIVGRQVELAGAAGDDRAAADAGQPLVVGQQLAGLAHGLVEHGDALLDLADDGVQCLLVDLRAGAQRRQCLALAFQFLDQVGLEVGAAGDVNDLEQRGQRDMVLLGMILAEEVFQPIEQVLQAQECPDAFVERVFVQNQVLCPCRAPGGPVRGAGPVRNVARGTPEGAGWTVSE
ncbi:hypothetical protein D3C72_1269090 [compost metagenome]